jgi:hypothetical protein
MHHALNPANSFPNVARRQRGARYFDIKQSGFGRAPGMPYDNGVAVSFPCTAEFLLSSHPRCLLPAALAMLACVFTPAFAADEEPIATDRPDFVESSDVVGKGRMQVETSIARDRTKGDGDTETLWATPTLLRFGIGETIELRIESDGALRQRSSLAGHAQVTERGYADTSLGMKWHAMDAVGNLPSVGVLLHADLSTGSAAFRGEGPRPTARVVAEWDLPHDLSLGIMPGIGHEKDNGGTTFAIFGLVVGKSLSDRLRGFVEVSSPHIARATHGGTEANLSVGAAYLLQKNIQIDTAFSRGLNGRTPDSGLTVGLSIKL